MFLRAGFRLSRVVGFPCRVGSEIIEHFTHRLLSGDIYPLPVTCRSLCRRYYCDYRRLLPLSRSVSGRCDRKSDGSVP